MPVFAYEARDHNGALVAGAMEAANAAAAVAAIRRAGYMVVRVTEQAAVPSAPVSGERWARGVHLGTLVVFYRELATMVSSGMTLIQSLAVLERNQPHPVMRRVIRQLSRGIEQGQSLSQNMRRFPNVFSALAVAIIAAAEQSGKLDEMLGLLAEYTEQEQETRNMIRRETFYPKVLLVALLTIVPIGLLIATAISQGTGLALHMLATAVATFLLAAVLPLTLLYFAVKSFGGTTSGRHTLDLIKLSLPLLGQNLRKLALSKFARALSALYSAGIPIPSALPLAADSTGNAALTQALRAGVGHLDAGGTLSEALTVPGMIPDLVISMVQTGEQTGNIDATLSKVSDYYQSEAYTAIRQMAMTITPIAVVIAGIIVLVIAVSFYGGYFARSGL